MRKTVEVRFPTRHVVSNCLHGNRMDWFATITELWVAATDDTIVPGAVPTARQVAAIVVNFRLNGFYFGFFCVRRRNS